MFNMICNSIKQVQLIQLFIVFHSIFKMLIFFYFIKETLGYKMYALKSVLSVIFLSISVFLFFFFIK